MFLMNLAKIGT